MCLDDKLDRCWTVLVDDGLVSESKERVLLGVVRWMKGGGGGGGGLRFFQCSRALWKPFFYMRDTPGMGPGPHRLAASTRDDPTNGGGGGSRRKCM